ncbi:MAG TPA: class I SAM-dependent methyltransferase [Chloroflexota bacterium]|jgi:2-polyprenyl-3-methyl-5-hydroxy-6-metoxy-1,4-benzoquinol methylase
MTQPSETPTPAMPAEGPAPQVITERVREQYERYPYPAPRRTRQRRFYPLGAMDYVQHVLWPGRRDLSGLRVLDAGCGTGNTAVTIAKRHPEVEVVGIDLSETALDEARALARRLRVGSNLTLRRLAIEDADALDGPFDYIIAAGVLHHLVDPAAGLRILANLLTPTGGLGIMVFGTHGRHAVYLVQDLLRRLVGPRELTERLAFTRQLLANWPADHPFQPKRWNDMRWPNDTEIVDLLLHAQDHSYTVPELLTLFAGADLRLERFYDPPLYDPRTYVTEPAVVNVMTALPAAEQAAVAELLLGRKAKHWFFATRTTYVPAQPEAKGFSLLRLRPKRAPQFDWERAARRRKQGVDHFTLREHAFDFQVRTIGLSEWCAVVADHCDGERTAREIFELPAVQAAIPGQTRQAKLLMYGALLERLAEQVVLLFEP